MILTSFLLSFIFIKLIKDYATYFNLVDIPNQRSSHQVVTPRGAGIGIFLSVFIVAPFFYTSIFQSYLLAFGAILMIFSMGIWDDINEIEPKTKFIIITSATALLSLNDIRIDILGTYLGTKITLGYFAFPFTLIAVVSFTNAFNLIDGLDGLSGGIAIIIFSSLAYIGYNHSDIFIFVLSISTISALFAFLIFNWNPASIFMGDSGSLMIGFLISLLSIKAITYIHPVSILYLSALPIFDTIVVFIRRIKDGNSPFKADKSHIHHILLKVFNGNVKKTVLSLLLMQLLFTLLGIFIFSNMEYGLSGLIIFISIASIFYKIFTNLYKKQQLQEII
jgi:UDP-GlcNAc:undecaprenyl-phosphate GlcNAc-1-phosphate transferase